MRMKQITAYDKQNKRIHSVVPLYRHVLIPMLPSPCSHPHTPIPTSCSRTPIFMIGMLFNLSCGVVMLLGWEHGDRNVDKAFLPMILSPPSCPNTPNAVLCSHPHTPPCTLIPTIPAKIKEMLYYGMLYELTFSVKLEDRKKYLVKKMTEERNR